MNRTDRKKILSVGRVSEDLEDPDVKSPVNLKTQFFNRKNLHSEDTAENIIPLIESETAKSATYSPKTTKQCKYSCSLRNIKYPLNNALKCSRKISPRNPL